MYSSKLIKALTDTGIPAAHYGWEKNLMPTTDHIVYAEESGDDFLGDGKHAETGTEGTVDLYTRDYTETTKNKVEAALEGLENVVWRLNSIQFENDTRYVHFEWVVSEFG